MKYDFLSIGGLTEDLIFFVDEGLLIDNKENLLQQELLAFEQGAKIKVNKVGSYFGGGASNTAVNLRGLDFKVACLAQVGEDERGKRILANLKSKKVDTSWIEFSKKEDSGLSLILNSSGDRIIFTYRGTNDSLQLKAKHKKLIKSSRWVYLSSMPDDFQKSLEIIFSAKNKIAWNPGLNQLSSGATPISSFLKRTDIFLVNKDESLELVKKTKKFSQLDNDFLNDINNLIKIVKGFGPDKVVITDGLGGAYFYDGDNFFHQKIIKKQKRVDSTGVGDAFNSTTVAVIDKTRGDFVTAMFLGVKNVASIVSQFGAQNGLLDWKILIKK